MPWLKASQLPHMFSWRGTYLSSAHGKLTLPEQQTELVIIIIITVIIVIA
jgi:hypothetical protein